jgi:hypothetical protein
MQKKKMINQLGLRIGNKMEYVYDFGDDLQHIQTYTYIVKTTIRKLSQRGFATNALNTFVKIV